MSEDVMVSPLSGRKKITVKSGSAIVIEELSDRGMIDLRLDTNDFNARTAAEKALGFTLPTAPRTSSQSRGRVALWWSPDQWIITCARGQSGNLANKLETAMVGHHAMVTDVSSARTIIKLTGKGARETIMKGASADLFLSEFAVGHVRRTQIAETAVALFVASLKPETIEIFVLRSYADYLWQWLMIAGRKGAAIQLFQTQEPPKV